MGEITLAAEWQEISKRENRGVNDRSLLDFQGAKD